MDSNETTPILVKPKAPKQQSCRPPCTIALLAVVVCSLYIFCPMGTFQHGPSERYEFKSLKNDFKGEIFYPEDEGFKEALSGTLIVPDTLPEVVFVASNEKDVVLATKIANKSSKNCAVLSGGHAYGGTSMSDGIVISVRKLNSISVDINSNTIKAGPGLTMVQSLEHLKPYNLGIVTGVCPSVSMGGYYMGGGWGLSSRKQGLGIDTLVGARVVLSNGTIVVANSNENKDLFWAIRGGGGGNFGIVTEYTVQAYPDGDEHTSASFSIQPSDYGAFFSWFANQVDNGLPNELACSIDGGMQNGIQVQLVWIEDYGESFQKGENFIREWVKSIPVQVVSFQVTTTSLIEMLHAIPILDNLHFTNVGGFIGDNYEASLNDFINVFTKLDKLGPYFAIEVQLWGGKQEAVGATDTAFYWRNSRLCTVLEVIVDPKEEGSDETYEKLTNMLTKEMGKIEHHFQGAYVNYQDVTKENEALARLYYGKNLNRLKKLKRKYNPKNLWASNQTIPPVHEEL